MQNLPCPFCGSLSQEIYDLYYDGQHTLTYCNDCSAQAGVAEDEQRAIARVEYPQPDCPSSTTNQISTSVHSVVVKNKKNTSKEKLFGAWCKCGAQGSQKADREGAITAWNTRISQQPRVKNTGVQA